MAVVPVPRITSPHRMRWRTVMTVFAVAWIVTFVVIAVAVN
jgi:hypothetical protein